MRARVIMRLRMATTASDMRERATRQGVHDSWGVDLQRIRPLT